MNRCGVLVIAIFIVPVAMAQELIFSDGFEFGDPCRWSQNTAWNGWDEVHPPDSNLDQITFFIADAALSGESWSNGGANSGSSSSRVGDTALGLDSSMMLTFDVSDLFDQMRPETRIVEVVLWMHQEGVVGQVYVPPMTEVKVEHTQYSSLWGAWSADSIPLTIGTPTISTYGESGFFDVAVTRALQYQQATCQNHVQFRLRFHPENLTMNGLDDHALFSRSSGIQSYDPRLTIVYREE